MATERCTSLQGLDGKASVLDEATDFTFARYYKYAEETSSATPGDHGADSSFCRFSEWSKFNNLLEEGFNYSSRI